MPKASAICKKHHQRKMLNYEATDYDATEIKIRKSDGTISAGLGYFLLMTIIWSIAYDG